MDDGTHLAPKAEEGEKGEDNDSNPFPNPERVKAIPARARTECTNKNAAELQRCWRQVFIARLHLKSLPRPVRGEAAAARLGGWREGKNCCFGQIKQGETGFTLGWVSVVLPGSVLWKTASAATPPALAVPWKGHSAGPSRAWPGVSRWRWLDALGSVDWQWKGAGVIFC